MTVISAKNQAKKSFTSLIETVSSLKRRHFVKAEHAFPVLCSLKIRNSLQSALILNDKNLSHDALACLRTAFETLFNLIGYFRISNYKKRRHCDFLKDKRDLYRLKRDAKNLSPDETLEDINNVIKKINVELDEYKKKGIIHFKDIHTIAKECKLLRLKKLFYKLMCLSTHPTTLLLSKYCNTTKTPIQFIDYPASQSELVYSGIHNIALLTKAVLNQHFDTRENIKTVEEIIVDIKYSEKDSDDDQEKL
jgi:hypothetical protein